MILALLLTTIAVSPDASVEFGYGRVVNKIGKPSSELVRLRGGIKIEDWLHINLSASIPTTIPASIGLHIEIEKQRTNLWGQLELGHTGRYFVAMASCGWYIFGIELQIHNRINKNGVIVFGKVSFPIIVIYQMLNDKGERGIK